MRMKDESGGCFKSYMTIHDQIIEEEKEQVVYEGIQRENTFNFSWDVLDLQKHLGVASKGFREIESALWDRSGSQI